ncbi:SusC/RagA family TonB-linked outer membrane protein [Prolixibacteraceae bacterium JC049]|nr:SusC/RagA family TonB-linked outer membrane protein [Prolixibacteraceae bacterium JC049]
MKKDGIIGFLSHRKLQKLFLIMRISMILLLACMLNVSAAVYSQSNKLSLKIKNDRIENVLKLIEQQSGYRFFYQNEQIDADRKVSLKVTNQTVTQVLNQIFDKTEVQIKHLDDKLILLKKREAVSTQDKQKVTGKVTDAKGVGIPGVSVVVTGTAIGITTDIDGNYTLTVPAKSESITFSFVGMKPQIINIDGQSTINVTLVEDAIGLEEVVAIGYGVQTKRDLTGAVTRADLSGKETNANVDIAQALQGYVPGVNIQASSGAGDSPSINIRGKTSLSASDKPLLVLDGIIYNGELTNINVNDINSIDILKDASAAAVYGSRSANGVLLITTKKGKSEKPQFNFNSYVGFQDLSPTDMTKRMNGEQYMNRLVDYAYQSEQLYPWYATNPTSAEGRPVRPDVNDPSVVSGVARSTEEFENWQNGNEVDWMDEVLRSNAMVQNYNLSISGKTKKTNYFLSGSFMDQEGIILGDDFNRATVRANFVNDVTDWLQLTMNSSYSFIDKSGVSASLNSALVGSPWANKTLADGSYPIDLAGESVQGHPLSNTVADDSDKQNNVFLAFKSKIEVPWIKGLTYEFNYSNSFFNRRHFSYYNSRTASGNRDHGKAVREHTNNKNWLINNIINYTRTFNEKHKVDVTLLGSREERTFSKSTLTGTNFDIETLGYNGMANAGIQKISNADEEESNLAYMARMNYAYDRKYLLTATIRRDGFSGFATNNKTATFKSFSLGWVMSEESFMKSIGWLDFLKTRLSYGENGNQDAGRFASFAKAKTQFTVFGSDSYLGYYPNSLGNPDLKWETTSSFNFGVDFRLLDSRLNGSIDVYKAKTEDVLVKRSIPKISGFTNLLENIGEVENKGIELSLNSVNVKSANFQWDTRFSFSLNRNKLVKLFGGEKDFDIGNGWFSGEPINTYYGYNNLGVVYTEEEFFNGEVPEGFYPGHYKIEDIQTTGDNKQYDPSDDRKILGTSDPNYRFGIFNSLTYKNFNLSFFINSVQGGGNRFLGSPGNLVAGGTDYSRRQNQSAVRPYWRPDAPTTNSPGMYWSQPVSGPLLIDRSFVRLQDVTLTYNFNSQTLRNWGINNLRVYLSGKNLYTWTDWTGWDPDIDRPSDGKPTPVMRSFIFGMNFSF